MGAKQATFELQLEWNSLDTKGKVCLEYGESHEGKHGLGYFYPSNTMLLLSQKIQNLNFFNKMKDMGEREQAYSFGNTLLISTFQGTISTLTL